MIALNVTNLQQSYVSLLEFKPSLALKMLELYGNSKKLIVKIKM